MKTKIIMLVVISLFAGNANAQWAVIDPTNLAQGIVNTTKEIAQASKTVSNTLVTDIYVSNFQIMLSDKNFRPEELNAIAFGYAKLLDESSDVLTELKNVVNINGLSMTDAERMERIDKAYNAVLNYRNLVSYYTRKNISVSYLRAKKINDTDRVMALYGTANDRYW